MPITPAHHWHESEAWVSIDVKIPNVTTTSADIVMTECYVKVNCTPYFFEADLYSEVDSKLSKVSVGLGAVKFFLVKREQGLWDKLSIQGDKYTRLSRRQQSLEAIREEREKIRKEYGAKFSNIGRLAVGEQMRMEEVKRRIIEKRKEEENLMEQENIESWKEDLAKKSQLNGMGRSLSHPHLEDIYDASTPTRNSSKKLNSKEQTAQSQSHIPSSFVGESIPKELGIGKNIKDSSKGNNQNPSEGRPILDDFNAKDEQESFLDEGLQLSPSIASGCNSSTTTCVGLRQTVVLPAPRNCPTVSVTFSPKPDLPKHLPARESRDKEIKLKKSGKACEDTLDVSERAPLFLQDKGDKFFKAGDYQSAINAYTDALKKDSSLVTSFANRGACKLHLKEYKACVQDCTSALCILTKGTPDCAQETILAQNLLVQQSIIGQDSLVPIEDCNSSRPSCDVIHHHDGDKDLDSERLLIRFPVESLELLTCLSGQGWCSMQGLIVEGAGVEQWKLGIKKHMLIRRGVAQYYLGELLKAIDDFAKVVQIKPINEEVNRILRDLRMAQETMNEQS